MKTRYGFVSNSSSSSFIVALKPELNGSVKLNFEINLGKHASYIISNTEDLDADFTERQRFSGNYKNDPRYLEMKKEIEDGKIIFVGSFASDGYSDEERFLSGYGMANLVDAEDLSIKVIEGEGGY